jgi:hypothetical protein
MDKRRIHCAIAAVAALTALPATTLSATDPFAVLASARTAAGNGDWSQVGVLIETGSERAIGLSGHWRKVVDLATGRTREVSDFGVFSTAEVWDGHNYWRQDHSGGVHPIDSAFMQTVHVTDGWLAAYGYLRRNARGAQLERLGDQTVDGRSFAVIRATPHRGQPVELWFDKKTKLLARTVQIMSTYVRAVRYGDYRKVRGLLLPFEITTEGGVTADTDVIQIDRIDRAGSANNEFRRPQPPDDFTIAGGKTIVPVDFDGDVIVEANLNGQGPFAFILDTGGHDILTPDAASELGLQPVGAGASGGSGEGTVSEQYARVDRMDIGGMTMRNQAFTVIPLQFDMVERGAKPALAGILGLELFERFAMQLDYRAKTLAFEPLSGYRHQGGGTAVPIFFSDDMPLAVAEIDGVSGDVGLDTGNSGTLVVQGIWADNHGLRQEMMSGFPSLGFGMGGVSPSWTSRADLDLAGHSFPRIIAHYSDDKKGGFSSRTEAGNVGNDILASFALDFDYGHGQIWFEPVPGHVPQPFPRAGVTVYKGRVEAFKVAAVASGTPAAEAGLQVDDEIIAVDGTPSKQLSGWDFRRAMRRPPGTKMTLSIVRKGQPHTVVTTLRELLP